MRWGGAPACGKQYSVGTIELLLTGQKCIEFDNSRLLWLIHYWNIIDPPSYGHTQYTGLLLFRFVIHVVEALFCSLCFRYEFYESSGLLRRERQKYQNERRNVRIGNRTTCFPYLIDKRWLDEFNIVVGAGVLFLSFLKHVNQLLPDIIHGEVGDSLICKWIFQGPFWMLMEVGVDFLVFFARKLGHSWSVLFSKFRRLFEFPTNLQIVVHNGTALVFSLKVAFHRFYGQRLKPPGSHWIFLNHKWRNIPILNWTYDK